MMGNQKTSGVAEEEGVQLRARRGALESVESSIGEIPRGAHEAAPGRAR